MKSEVEEGKDGIKNDDKNETKLKYRYVGPVHSTARIDLSMLIIGCQK